MHSAQHSSASATQSSAPTGAMLQEARQAMDILTEMASLLNTGLDRETLSVCVAMCEAGVNPEALAAVIKELSREARATTHQQN
ncbi:hypothetical protein BGZ73_002089 [Actinomortierella ambigua]|nr:hypothetical protein BGZ73_002089 [Actinomortierella ambigua]